MQYEVESQPGVTESLISQHIDAIGKSYAISVLVAQSFFVPSTAQAAQSDELLIKDLETAPDT